MYMPDHFTENDQAQIAQLMDEAPFASLIVLSDQGVMVDHLPLLRFALPEGGLALRGHVARANPLCRAFDMDAGTDCLVLFNGPQGYISPNWYPSKQQQHKAVPTWNYQAVHVRGKVRFFEDTSRLRQIVHALTSRFEHETNPDNPWAMGDAPANFVDQMIANIIGVEIAVTTVEAKSKLSQNRTEEDRLAVIEALTGAGNQPLAGAMRAKKKGRP